MAANTNYGALKRVINKRYPELLVSIEQSWRFSHSPASFLEVVYQYMNPTDIVCSYGNTKKFEYFRTGYVCKKTCRCSFEKHAATMLTRYGVEHALQSTEIYNKFTNTIKDKYGVDQLSQINVEQKESTNINRYGAKTPLQSPIIKDKIKNITRDNLGVDYPFQLSDVRTKATATVFNKYGVNCVFSLPDVKKAAADAIKEKYGVSSVLSLLSVQQTIKDNILEKYGVPFVSQRHIDPQLLTEFHNDDRFIEIYTSLSSVVEIQNYFGVKATSIHRRAANLNLPRKHTFVSIPEQEIVDFLKPLVVNILQSNRTIIAPKELDIVLPDLKIGIEFDGLYHHSDAFVTDIDLHKNKTIHAEQNGYKLIHIFEDEWLFKQDIVKSRLRNLIGLTSTRIYARHTRVVELTFKQIRQFLDMYHIQGSAISSINYGLMYNDDLVAVMSFGKPRFNKHIAFELIRYCTKMDCTVVGGPSKLLAHFRRFHTGDIISYADRRWSQGNLYKQLGFEFQYYTNPNYYYIMKQHRYNRTMFQKHKLKDKLDQFDPDLSEFENMKNNGYNKIYDCGNSVWILRG